MVAAPAGGRGGAEGSVGAAGTGVGLGCGTCVTVGAGAGVGDGDGCSASDRLGVVTVGKAPPTTAGVGQLDDSPELVVLRARKVMINADSDVPVQLDGDSVGTTPVTIDLLPEAIRLVVPLAGE